jgi:hypothetical protein
MEFQSSYEKIAFHLCCKWRSYKSCYFSAPLFDVQLDVDVHNPSRFLLKLTAPSHQSKFQSESSFSAQCKTQIVAQEKRNVNLKDVYHNKYLACTVSCCSHCRRSIIKCNGEDMLSIQPFMSYKIILIFKNLCRCLHITSNILV